MLKKKFAAFIAVALIQLSSSAAFAAFADLDLVQVVYERNGGAEYATDLGNIRSGLSNYDVFKDGVWQTYIPLYADDKCVFQKDRPQFPAVIHCCNNRCPQ